jgi:hypothetical protein
MDQNSFNVTLRLIALAQSNQEANFLGIATRGAFVV